MVILDIRGAFGNQLFEYAAGRAISLRNNTKLYVDMDYMTKSQEWVNGDFLPREFHLPVTNAKFETISPSKLQSLRKQSVINKLFGRSLKTYNADDIESIDEIVTTGNIYLTGFWQKEEYFKQYEETIRKDLEYKHAAEGKDLEYISEIKKEENPIALHVRRTDYITNKDANAIHGTLSLDYYIESVKLILSKVGNPKFYIFSDDPEWTQANLKFDAPMSFVTHNPINKGYEDMRIMSECKHFIIANSTFSWWGAWIGEQKDSIIIGPKNWFRDSKSNNKQSIIPDRWLKV